MTSDQPLVPQRRPRSAVERHCTATPVLVDLLVERSGDSREDVCEYLELVPTVAEFLSDYTPLPPAPITAG
jgi:hypothetical protein